MRVLAVLAAAAVLAAGTPVKAATAAPAAPAIQMTEFMAPTGDPGISLYLRNKHPRTMTAFRPSERPPTRRLRRRSTWGI